MKIKDFLISHPENNDLPLIICVENKQIFWRSCMAYICNKDTFDYEFVQGCAQLSLDGENSFVIIYAQERV